MQNIFAASLKQKKIITLIAALALVALVPVIVSYFDRSATSYRDICGPGTNTVCDCASSYCVTAEFIFRIWVYPALIACLPLWYLLRNKLSAINIYGAVLALLILSYLGGALLYGVYIFVQSEPLVDYFYNRLPR